MKPASTSQVSADRPADSLHVAERTALEANPQLATNLIHEFSDVLGAVRAFANLVRQEAKTLPHALENLDHLLRAVGRARALVDQMSNLALHVRQKRRPIDPQAYVQRSLQLIRSGVPPSVQWSAVIAPNTPRIEADPVQLHQLLLNLCANAVHALRGEGGQLEVHIEPFTVDEAFAQSRPRLKTGAYARITVRDTGRGADTDFVRRAFDTSWVPREGGEAPELGLRVVRSIVRQHEGLLELETQPGEGTLCTIYLPAHVEPGLDLAVLTPRGKGEHVLYVDDELDCCRATEQLLRRLGYDPVAHTDPALALEDFRRRSDFFRIAVLDLNMPTLTGVDLATLLLEHRPDLPVYLTTGYSGLWTPEMAINLGIRGILAKPVPPEVWTQTLEDALRHD